MEKKQETTNLDKQENTAPDEHTVYLSYIKKGSSSYDVFPITLIDDRKDYCGFSHQLNHSRMIDFFNSGREDAPIVSEFLETALSEIAIDSNRNFKMETSKGTMIVTCPLGGFQTQLEGLSTRAMLLLRENKVQHDIVTDIYKHIENIYAGKVRSCLVVDQDTILRNIVFRPRQKRKQMFVEPPEVKPLSSYSDVLI